MKVETIQRKLTLHFAAGVIGLSLLTAGSALAQERVVKISGFGALSGVLRPFGVNSEAAMRAAADQINQSGGVKLADGTHAKIVIDYFDDRCNPEEGIAVTRRIAASDALVAIGTTCSSVVEPVYGALQKKAGDPNDSGLRLPIFTDVAQKIGLTKISEWAFRNIPDEPAMYDALFTWLKANHPEAKTIYGGVEENFVHSRQAWYAVMKEKAKSAGYEVKGEAKWLVDDTNFTEQVRAIKNANTDIVAVSAHPFTACGVLKEMSRQGVKPKVLIGLTSQTTPELLEVCGPQAEGIVVPTSYAPINPKAKAAATATARYKGYADLHSMAAWENMFTLKQVMEAAGISARADTVMADREKIRVGLAKLKQMDGLLGASQRTPDRESIKPFVLVQAKHDTWQLIATPKQQHAMLDAAASSSGTN
ncbi:MAG: ABC transporter substrate-binding protein [Sulfurifustaceae bacterium]